MVNSLPTATIDYPGSPYCSNEGTVNVERNGDGGGTVFCARWAIYQQWKWANINTGASTPGTYTVTYTIDGPPGCPDFTTTTSVTISDQVSATINYPGSPYCSNEGTVNVVRNGDGGGTYSAPGGLSINSGNGNINTGASTPGTYTVTYTIDGPPGCPDFTTTTSVTISDQVSATIDYPGSPYCSNEGTISVSRTGDGGDLIQTRWTIYQQLNWCYQYRFDTPGTYTVTYTLDGPPGCPDFTTTTSVTISDQVSATIDYPGSPYCSNQSTISVSRTGDGGGTILAPGGLSINSSTGAINTGSSTPGTYRSLTPLMDHLVA